VNIPDDIGQWRKQQRAALLARRENVSEALRSQWNTRVTRRLLDGFPLLARMVVGIYWPFRGEFDPRYAMKALRDRGARAALPIVVTKAAPLQFREWWPGAPMARGVFDLPVPDGTAIVQPQALLIPPIGFDAQGYRLGYGGGYFDRTLACLTPQPLKIGVGFELSRIPTIHPQHHDVPMDFIVTDVIHHVAGNGLQRIADLRECADLAERIVRERGHPAARHDATVAPDADPGRPDPRGYASSPFHGCQADPLADDA
jgi:5,10-methenyltetrahydrofolate synthetase